MCAHCKLQSQLVQTKEALAFGELGQEGTDGVAASEKTAEEGQLCQVLREIQHLFLLGLDLQYRTEYCSVLQNCKSSTHLLKLL